MSHIEIGTIDQQGRFTQKDARNLPHVPEDAGYPDAVVCVCGVELVACQGCAELVHHDQAVKIRGAWYHPDCFI